MYQVLRMRDEEVLSAMAFEGFEDAKAYAWARASMETDAAKFYRVQDVHGHCRDYVRMRDGSVQEC